MNENEWNYYVNMYLLYIRDLCCRVRKTGNVYNIMYFIVIYMWDEIKEILKLWGKIKA